MKAKDLIKQLQQFDPQADILVGDANNDANGYSEDFNFLVFNSEKSLRVNCGHPYVYLEAVFNKKGVVEHY